MQLCQFRGQLCPTSGLALKSLLRKTETLRLPWAAVLRALRFQVYVDRQARQGLDINKPPPPTYEKLSATVRLSGKRRTKLPPVQRMSLGCLHVQIIFKHIHYHYHACILKRHTLYNTRSYQTIMDSSRSQRRWHDHVPRTEKRVDASHSHKKATRNQLPSGHSPQIELKSRALCTLL